ncbi:GNAT family N-acetyltransferase [Roseovarius sp. E0-M6]|uniref:GNAT family N-acetyltransferase n=1 Tax=Roseovarius sp. E0-M6 TaxID=3127118 RepID=UPI00300FAAC6
MHRLGLFANDDYSAMLLAKEGTPPAHISSVFPGFMRFPFMKPEDLQIGATATAPEAAGSGLATRAIVEIVDRLEKPDRTFWYLTDAANAASCRVIEKAGFRLVGEGEKYPRLGVRALGYYDIRQ